MKNVIDVLKERGFIDQMTSPELRTHAQNPMILYHGIDPTADSLHLGNLMGIVALAWFQKFGHTPYALIGGGTGKIGDPSGKSIERPLLEKKTLEHNVASLSAFVKKILKNAVVVNNDDWLKNLSVIDFLRDVGKHFRIGPMLQKESVRTRLESEEGMSFTEFSYPLMQGYDFYYLNQHFGIELQIGGSDQWGNITAGCEFNRKMKGNPIYGLTWPLLLTSEGKKFGKSEQGAVWLSSEKLSPYHFYQNLVRVADADVIKLMKLLTFMEMEEIAQIEKRMSSEPNIAQKRLAEEVTRFVHGEEGLNAAIKVTDSIQPGTDAKLSAELFEEIAKDMPRAELSKKETIGMKFVDLAVKVGLVPSKSEGTRLVKNGGAYLNNERVVDPGFCIDANHLIDGLYLLLASGKKKKILVQVIP